MAPTPSSPGDEPARLSALSNLAIMDSAPEPAFDEITRLAAAMFDAGSCAISLIDDRRQWFKSRFGIDFSETPRSQAFCVHALTERALVEVPDARLDARFADNPLVTCADGIRFYAGAPLIIASGHCLGTLCVFDSRPRAAMAEHHKQALADLARIAARLIEARRHRRVSEIAAQVVDVTSDAVLCVDARGRINFWNMAAERMFGFSAQQALGNRLDMIVPERLAEAHRRGFEAAAAGGPTRLVGSGSVELAARRADGSEFPIELSLARWGEAEGAGGFAAIVRDVSSRKALERERERAQALLDTVVAHLPAMLFVKDAETREYLLVNRAGEKLIGLDERDVVGRTDIELFPELGPGYMARDTEALQGGQTEPFESAFVRADGRTVTVRTQRLIIDGPDAPGRYILGVSEDVTEIRRAEAEVLRLAHYDTLTGLLNRHSQIERLQALLDAATPLAMLSIDLDRFKAVNDQFGHPVGDHVLSQVGNRLRGVAQADDIVARVGGDEFVMILVGDRPAERARSSAAAILASLSSPYATERHRIHLGASIGIAIAPDDGRRIADLRQCTDLALYRAKEQGRGSICFFSAEMDAAARDRMAMERDLRTAIDEGEIMLAYQPVLAAATGQVTSLEALARWQHPVRGAIAPDLFIPIAEECGLIEALGARLLEIACEDALRWPARVRVAVNLSPLQFQTGDLFATISGILRRTGLAPGRLQLEVTEGLVIRDVERTFAMLERLRSLGIQILMDDFGVGYSSLSYFERFPFDKVKIDRSFVDKIGSSRAAGAIVDAVVGLGRALGMGIVAEGVETVAQMDALVAAGCTHLQGYLFSRPIGRDEVDAVLGAAPRSPDVAAFARSG